MPSDPKIGGQTRLYVYPATGSVIDFSIMSITKLSPMHDMKPVTTVKDYRPTPQTTFKAERPTTSQLDFGFDCFSEGEITPDQRAQLFSGKPVGPVYIILSEDDDDVYWLPLATMTIQMKPGTTEDFQQFSVDGKSFSEFLAGPDAATAYAAYVP